MFREIKGQDRALGVLSQAMEHGRVSQSYLFHGIDGVGKFTTALYFGMALNCLSHSEFRPCGVCNSCRKFLAYDHPDFIYLFPTPNWKISSEGEFKSEEELGQYQSFIRNKIESPWNDHYFKNSVEIRKDAIGTLIKRLDLSNFEAQYRICIIEDADEMNIHTSNAFLKTLEEPPADTVIILVTNRLSMLLPTIVSRCQQVYFPPVPPKVVEGILKEKFHTTHERALAASRIADGSVKRAVRLIQEDSLLLRDRAFEIVQMAAAGKDLAFYNSVSGGERLNGETVTELVRYVCMFVSDLNLISLAPELVTNIDKLEFIRQYGLPLYDTYGGNLADRTLDFTMQMEDLNRKLAGNVNPSLVMFNVYLKLCKVFRG